MTTVLVADDHPIVLEGLASLLQAGGFEVAVRCTNGAEVLEALELVQPDILVLDINMPVLGGIEVAVRLNEARTPPKIILLTSNLDDHALTRAVELNVAGIVLKEAAPQQLLASLKVVEAGGQWFDAEVAKRSLNRAHENGLTARLTARERDVVRLVAQGLRNKEIARELAITEGTAKMYLHKIYEKLGISSRFELMRISRDQVI